MHAHVQARAAPCARRPLTVLSLQAYMEDHLKNKNRLEKEWEALCAYQAEPNSSLVAQREENAPKNRCPAVLTCAYPAPGGEGGGRAAPLLSRECRRHPPGGRPFPQLPGRPLYLHTVLSLQSPVWTSPCGAVPGVKPQNPVLPLGSTGVSRAPAGTADAEHVLCLLSL